MRICNQMTFNTIAEIKTCPNHPSNFFATFVRHLCQICCFVRIQSVFFNTEYLPNSWRFLDCSTSTCTPWHSFIHHPRMLCMVRQRVSLSSLSGWLLSSFLLSLHIWRVAEPLSPLDLQTLQRQNCILRPNWLIFDDLGGGGGFLIRVRTPSPSHYKNVKILPVLYSCVVM